MNTSHTPAMQLEQVASLAREFKGKKDQLMLVLLKAQKITGHNALPEDVAVVIAEEMGVTKNHIYDFATFYAMFSTEKRGKHVIRVCKSTPCHVNKASNAAHMLEKTLGIKMGETTEDGQFTLEHIECIGVCDRAPAMLVDDEVYGPVTEESIPGILSKYQMQGEEI
ncbi:NAD(P)H-dependent oxidoreductase subunit E [Sansalvadorimonas sp. 2012CJ34-2]|uniref:NADH-quinone oxidoreductase subunit E n=1 Tax=Parendozoicomonas callyspongiae TaxID=2942213 RepID=A0ABT0PE22_9GAMM|nr:NAD(P)H-dependent oxidoreductase subunit E [Sansalvadorimonas sp. 2012CJ34-2]MCL6269619.1 NAD(P)H-dependent oxidoreductase subunit E [Sansalvadorimonas sp. 2012CJ34-2]